jgi:hypothetical protein
MAGDKCCAQDSFLVLATAYSLEPAAFLLYYPPRLGVALNEPEMLDVLGADQWTR